MASQGQMALLSNPDDDIDNEDTESSSSSSSDDDTSTSTTSADSEMRITAPPAGAADLPLSAESGLSSTLRDVDPKAASSGSMPAKKRIRLHLAGNDTEKKAVSSSPIADAAVVGEETRTARASQAKQPSTIDVKPVPSSSLVMKSMKLSSQTAAVQRVRPEGDVSGDNKCKSPAINGDFNGGNPPQLQQSQLDSSSSRKAQITSASVQVPIKTKSSTLADSLGLSSPRGKSNSTGKTRVRSQTQAMKPIRFPPMSSPGLLTYVPLTGAFRETVDSSTGMATPAAVFSLAMKMAGYTLENRSKKPHRGSSVQRVVDDIFDSNVKFALHFPKLIPHDLVDDQIASSLLRAFPMSSSSQPRKRKLPGFAEMAPKSLTLSYPEEYLKRRRSYIDKVNAREKAIVEFQERELALDERREKLEAAAKPAPSSMFITPDTIPPIPNPPSPPRINEMDAFVSLHEDNHPIYPPKNEAGGASLVSHLDKDCFHVVDGRYFGLSSNYTADPNFSGPSAHGLSLSGGTGLATANTATLLTSPSQYGASIHANPIHKQSTDFSIRGKKTQASKKRKVVGEKTPKPVKGKKKPSKAASTKATASVQGKKANGPTPTATLEDLQRSIETGGHEATVLHKSIIESAVYASRCGKHSRNWRALNGEVYPNISRAFELHSNIKACQKCKNARLGVYYCRLRRRHDSQEFAGGDTFTKLGTMFKVPMEQLVVRAPKKELSTVSTTDPSKDSGCPVTPGISASIAAKSAKSVTEGGSRGQLVGIVADNSASGALESEQNEKLNKESVYPCPPCPEGNK